MKSITHLYGLIAAVLAIMAGIVSSTGQSFVTNGLVSYYPFSGNANDMFGANNGVPVDTIFTTDRFGCTNSAILLNGYSSYIGVNYSSSFDFPTNGGFTLSAWFQLNGYGSGSYGISSLIMKGGTDGLWDYGLVCILEGNPVLWAGRHYEYPCVSTNVLQFGQWYHGVITYSNANWALYQNGTLCVKTNTTYTITRSTGGIAIGRKGEASTDYFNGAIDDVRIYNRALSPDEVQKLHQYEDPLLTISPAAFNLSWFANFDLSYQVQWSTNLETWTVLTNVLGAGGETNVVDWVSGARRFYRLVIQ